MLPSHLLGYTSTWRTQILSSYLRKWVIVGVLIGLLVGLCTILFLITIHLATSVFLGGLAGLIPPLPSGEGSPVVTAARHRWMLPAATTLGGLLSAMLVYRFAPETAGGGLDAAIEAFHEDGGRIRARVPAIKLIASSIITGSGGSAGREGPSAQMGAGIGSLLGSAFGLNVIDRRIAVAAGIGAGIGAVFKAPLGGAILSAEILYTGDFESEALVPGFIASAVGYSVVGAWSGWSPIFATGAEFGFSHLQSLLGYALLGAIAGLVGLAYIRIFHAVKGGFEALPVSRYLKPALGGLGVGLVALAFPQVLSMGYGWVQIAITGDTAQLAVWTMLALVLLKMLTTSMTVGSGGSGGDFAPILYVGGMLGGGLWGLLHQHMPGLSATPGPFVVVGMLALLGGMAKAPLAVILMVAEMTGQFSMLVPAMVAATIAYLITGDQTIYGAQAPSQALSPAHRGEYTIPLIQSIGVSQAMRTNVVTVDPAETISVAEERMNENGFRGLPVVDDQRLAGMFTTSDALRARQQGSSLVSDAMSTNLVVAYPADSLYVALLRMTRAGVSRLPVVQREDPERLLGILSIRNLATALDTQVTALAKQTPALPVPRNADPLRSIQVRAAMGRQFEMMQGNLPLKRAANRLSASGQHAAVVVGDAGDLQGIVTVRDLTLASTTDDTDRPVGEIATRKVIVARLDQSVAEALAQPGAEALRQLPVVEVQEGWLVPVGVLRRSDVLAAYLRGRDRQALIAQRVRSLAKAHQSAITTLGIRVGAQSAVAGHTLSELRLPRDSVVTGVLRDGTVLIPRGQLRLQEGDDVQVIAAAEVTNELQQRFTNGHR